MKIQFSKKIELDSNNLPVTWYRVFVNSICQRRTQNEDEAKATYKALVDLYKSGAPQEQILEEIEIIENNEKLPAP